MLCRSQLVAAAGLVGAGIVSYLVQPHYEVFTRWNHGKKEHGKDTKVPGRVNRIARSVIAATQVFDKLCVPEEILNKVDFFLTNNAESVALGSLRSADTGNFQDYAFIGLPFLCAYEEPADITLEDMKFASPLFPFTAYSELGERRLNLTCISDAALEFLIARELAALLGSRKLAECRQSSRHASEVKRDFGNFLPPRLVSRFSCLSLFGSLYLAYQTCFCLNRLLGLRFVLPRAFRGLAYTCVTALILICQRQLLVAWRHNAALSLDASVASCHPDLLAGGLEYYSWKQEWNAFWTRSVLPSARKAMQALAKVTRAALDSGEQLSPILRHQVQWALDDSNHFALSDRYFIPASIDQAFGTSCLRLDDCNLRYLRTYRLPGYDVNTQQGDEKFASDGDILRFNVEGLLAFGTLPVWLAFIFEALSFPATCGQRKAALEKMV